MDLRRVGGLSLFAAIGLLVLGVMVFVSPFVASAQVGLIAPGTGGVQVINADSYLAYPGTNVKFLTYACPSLPCTKDVQAKFDLPTATFPASIQIYFDVEGSGWQNQVFSLSAPQSIMQSPHNLDLGNVSFSKYGLYVISFVENDTASTAWEYFQVQQG
jgi:hypothetical protein